MEGGGGEGEGEQPPPGTPSAEGARRERWTRARGLRSLLQDGRECRNNQSLGDWSSKLKEGLMTCR